MEHVTYTPYVFQSNLVAERIVEHRKNLGFFKKMRIEVNQIGKTAQSFISRATCGLIKNPFSLSNSTPNAVPYYAEPHSPQAAKDAAAYFNARRSQAIAKIADKVALDMKIEAADSATLSTRDFKDEVDNDAALVDSPMHRQKRFAVEDNKSAFAAYGLPVAFDDDANSMSLQEAAFKAHHAKALLPTPDPEKDYGETYRTAVQNSPAHIPEEVLLNIVRSDTGKWISRNDLQKQCIVSFRVARVQAFYETLRNHPEFQPLFHPHASKAAAEYDKNFAAAYSLGPRTDNELILQNYLAEAHRRAFPPMPSNPKFTFAFIDKFHAKLNEHANAPLLLSKMAAHTLEQLNAAQFIDTTKIRGPVHDGIDGPDQLSIALFLNEKNRILSGVIKKYPAAFRDALGDSEDVAPDAVLRHFAAEYNACFLEKFKHFRDAVPENEPDAVPMALRTAHRLAAAKIFPHPDIHLGPLAELNRLIDQHIGPIKDAAAKLIRSHIP